MVGKNLAKYLYVLGLAPCALLVPDGRGSVITAEVGTNSSKSAPLVTALEATPEAIRFEAVPVGETYTQAVRITNVGVETIQITKISASNTNFQVSGIFLPVVIAHGTSESFTISYRPKSERVAEAQVRVFTTVGGEPLVVRVRASTGASQTELTASEANVDFEDVAIGSIGHREVSLKNSGNRDVKIAGISVSGPGFGVSGASAVNLSPGQQVFVDINFAPKSTGRQGGSLKVSDVEGESLLEIPLAAIGAPSSQSSIRLNWEDNLASATGYAVYRAADPSGPYTRIASEVPSSEYIDTGLAAGRTYYYVVTALDADQIESEYSLPISATVPVV